MKPIIQTTKGAIQGIELEFAHVYKGVPYAKPPIGNLRFCAPQPCDAWEGTIQTKCFQNRACQVPEQEGSFYQREFFSNEEYVPAMSEDCLYLNVWKPKNVTQKCPVAIWYHGGGFCAGHGSEIEFDGEAYAKRGIILVTVNYRLGIFGFFCHPELTQRDGHSGNYGLLDQIAALDWVRDNIDALNGDINNITIFGQSAGGMSVRALVTSPLVEGKVHRAIIQSCSGYRGFPKIDFTMEKMQKLYAKFLKKNHLSLDEFQKLPWESLVELGVKFNRFACFSTRTGLSMTPVIDHYVLTMFADDAADSGKTHRIPYMIGVTKNDMMVSKAGVKNPDKSKMLQSAIAWSKIHDKQGLDCYTYYFARQLPGDDAGAFHSSELWYIFGTLSRSWRPMEPQDYELSERMIDYWASFMKTGNPGWKKCTVEAPYVEILE